MNCSKALSISIAEPMLGDWWRMETDPTSNQVGAINSTPLIPHGTAMQTVAGKVNNGVLLNSVNGATDFSYFDTAVSASLLYDGNGVTAYGWIYWNSGSPAIQTFNKQYDFYDGSATRVGLIGVEFNGFVNQITIYVQSFPGAYSERIIAHVPVSGTWLFYRLFYDPIPKQVGIQLNNGVVLRSTAGVVTLPVSVTGRVAVMNYRVTGTLGVNTIIFDEVGMFPLFHSDAQASFVYNSGNGRTWPFTLP